MNPRDSASLEVLNERMANLIARVEAWSAELKTGQVEQGRRLDKLSSDIAQLTQRQNNSETAASNHYAADQIIHQSLDSHLDSHKKKEYQTEGRQEAFSVADRIFFRIGPLGMAVWVTYSFVKEALK